MPVVADVGCGGIVVAYGDGAGVAFLPFALNFVTSSTLLLCRAAFVSLL